VAQIVEYLPSKDEPLNSNPIPPKTTIMKEFNIKM
jgi:hypothetical protein